MPKYYINVEREDGKKETIAEVENKGNAEAAVVIAAETQKSAKRVWWSFWPIRKEKT